MELFGELLSVQSRGLDYIGNMEIKQDLRRGGEGQFENYGNYSYKKVILSTCYHLKSENIWKSGEDMRETFNYSRL